MTDTPDYEDIGYGIGAEVEQARAALLLACDALADLDDEGIADRLAPIRQSLEGYMARIAVVGQIKAGKSTLANCLTERVGFLPSDINPWTSVVTRLNFGHPSGKTSGARFYFYDEAQWDRLANRGGKLGELTEGLLEDYKREELFAQVNAMRDRAKLRLGDKFESLLGKSHRFEEISTEVIERYACAGDEPEERLRNPAAGRYNDITHTAEIFFEREPFGCPVCLMDTPGTNDPLLIREEITQQNLETADYFIVVLSAHQALSESDLNLVRILRALNRNRIVAFVNRIDEISNLTTDYEELRDRVAGRLKKELGGIDVPVVLGSAVWGASLLPGGEAVDVDLAHDMAALKLRSRENAALVRPDDDQLTTDLRVSSGLAELEQALSRQIYEGSVATLIGPAAEDLLSVAWQAVDHASLRLKTLEDQSGPKGAPIPAGEARLRLKQIEARVGDGLDTLIETTAPSWQVLGEKLAGIVSRFAQSQAEALASSDADQGSAISVDVAALREELKVTYAEGFNEIQGELWNGLRTLNARHGEAVDKALGNRMSGIRIPTLALLSVEPRVGALYRTVTLDFASSWLASLFSRRSARVKSAIDAVCGQFDEICDELIGRGREDFETQLREAVDRFITDLHRLSVSLASAGSTGEVGMQTVKRRVSDQLGQARAIVEELTRLRTLIGGEAERVAMNG